MLSSQLYHQKVGAWKGDLEISGFQAEGGLGSPASCPPLLPSSLQGQDVLENWGGGVGITCHWPSCDMDAR